MKKKIGIIVGVIVVIAAIVLGVIFLAPDKDVAKEKPSDNVQTTAGSNFAEEMKNTIDLNSVDLSEYGISDDREVSKAYPSSIGRVYLVRDFGADETKTYLFVTTKDKVMSVDTKTVGVVSISDAENTGAYTLQFADVDGKDGEEILLLTDTGGVGGKGIYEATVWTINDDKIQLIKFSEEEAFDVSLKAPFTVVFKNEALGYEKELVCEEDSESLFDEKGNPESEKYDSAFNSPYKMEVDSDGDEKTDKCIVSLTRWSYLARSVDGDVDSVVKYVFDESKQELVIYDAYVEVDAED